MKKQDSKKNIPVGLLIIAAFYLFGAVVLVANIFTNPAEAGQTIARAHGFSSDMSVGILATVAVFALVLAYGLISLSRWGFFLAIGYLLYMAVVSLVMGGLSFLWTGQADLQIYFGNLLWSTAVLIYIFIVRRRFLRKVHAGKTFFRESGKTIE